MGHVYQGRFKSFPIAADAHLLGTAEDRAILTESPVPLGRKWADHVNQPQSEAELETIRRSVQRGQPYGGDTWTAKVTKQQGLEHTFRPRGRPRKAN